MVRFGGTSNRCITKYCRNIPKSGKLCSTCYGREYRRKNPLKYAYQTLKDNAKRRKKVFTITFEEFVELCHETQYHHKKGIYKHSYHLDRIREEGGYSKGNLQILQNHENVRKYLQYYYCELNRKMIFSTQIVKTTTDKGDCPF